MEYGEVYWFDGRLCRLEDVDIHPLTHALHYGTGVFEGIRAYDTGRGAAIFRLEDHMRRLERSAQAYRLDVRYSVEELCAAVVAATEANGIRSAYIRPLIFFGEKTMKLAPTFACPTHTMVAVLALGGYFGEGREIEGIKTTISPWRKFSSSALPANVKGCGHYANSVLAMQDALGRGFDEAILLNDRGEVAEGTGENVFIVNDGVLRTNDLSADILDGITRASVLTLARDLGIRTAIEPMTLDALLGAQEVFFTGTAAEVTPIASIDEHRFPVGPLTMRLREAYIRATRGEDPKHPDWVTHV